MRKTLLAAAAARLGFPLLLGTLVSTAASAQQVAQKAAEPTASASEPAADPAEVIVIASGSQVDLTKPYAGGQVAQGGRVGLFGNVDLMDSPFNSTAYTADLIRNQQARSVADVVQNDPSVRLARGFGNFQEVYIIRGFEVSSDDIGYNGVYGLLPRQYVAAELLERTEVFRGANSFLNGAAPGGSGIGGTINLVPKRAPDDDLTRLSVGYESDAMGYAAADVARRFGDDKRWGVRGNLVGRKGDTSIDDEARELGVLALGLDYRGDKLRLSADLGYQDHRIDAPRPSVTPTTGIPDAPKSDSNFAQDWSFSEEKDLFGVARGEYDFTQHITAWAAVGVRDSEEHNVLANPSADADGNYTVGRFDNYREDSVLTGDAGVRFEFKTGSVGHRAVLSASAFELDSKNAYAMSMSSISGNLYDFSSSPQPAADWFTGGDMNDPLTTFKTKTSSYAIADTLALLDKRVLLTFGARYQVLQQYSYDYNTGDGGKTYDDNTWSPMAGLVFKTSDKVSLYANYIEGLIPGDAVPQQINNVPVENGGDALSPFKSRQTEVGAKYDGGNLGLGFALFEINKPSSFFDGTRVTQDGEQRNRGAELTWFGEPIDGYRVLGGITVLDAKFTKSDGADDGQEPIGVADLQANLTVEYDLRAVPGLSFEARGNYTASQKASTTNDLSIPSWTRLDLGTRYAFEVAGRAVTLRARVDNVTGRDYWASTGGTFGANYLVLGNPRTFTLSASVDL
ncbi:TonB-dependent receptor [Hydrocarboniphaga effusa]|uniref:TonB-dependent siderophore receptor n=2 Tax=Hydrocarboniphaga TaxID=243627 RepID=I8T5C2_9GAMM|nr:TonB-dependent receptor [Hydrocarboniphaga effusa]EIT68928.1 TonB-dependent siderophore receptor [Hydrocarboniphaga effusa AP103]